MRKATRYGRERGDVVSGMKKPGWRARCREGKPDQVEPGLGRRISVLEQ
jgi:hypothetical protein